MGGENRVFAVLGGARLNPMLLGRWAKTASYVAAADSGADALLEAGVTPDLVVGDMDSIVTETHAISDVRHMPDLDSTDCDKLLSVLADLGHRSVTLANVEGDLPDHVLATWQSAAKSRLICRLLLARGFGHIVVGAFTSRFEASSRVSLLPLSLCEGVHLSGVRWPIDDDHLDPLGFSSISNEAIKPQIEVSIRKGAALLFIEGSNEPVWP